MLHQQLHSFVRSAERNVLGRVCVCACVCGLHADIGEPEAAVESSPSSLHENVKIIKEAAELCDLVH